MKINISLLLSILTGMLPCIAPTKSSAADDAVVPNEVVKNARGAVLSVKQDFEETGTFWRYCATLINDDGWAVVPVKAMAYRLPPTFRDSKRQVVKFKKILAVNRKLSLAVVQLDIGKRQGLKLASKDLALREPVALLWDDVDSMTQGVLDGPVLARRQIHARGPQSPFFLSLGFYLGGDNPRARTGSPVINSDGDLVGIYTSTHGENMDVPKQTLAVTAKDIAALVKVAEANPEGLPFPLLQDNPFDVAFWAYNLSPQTVKRTVTGLPGPRPGQDAKGLRDGKVAQLTALAAKYPESDWARTELWSAIGAEAISRLTAIYAAFVENDSNVGNNFSVVLQELMSEIEATGKKLGMTQAEIDEQNSGMKRVMLHFAKDFRTGLKLDQKELALWGDDPPGELLANIAFAQAETGDVKAAAETWKRASALATDSLHYQRLYEFFLNKHFDAAEAKRVSDLVWELEEFYSPRRPRRIP